MRQITPSQLREAEYRRTRARRYPPVNGVPDPRATISTGADLSTLGAICRATMRAWLDELLPSATRAAVAAELDRDLEHRFPAAEMIVLGRYGLARAIDTAFVDAGGVRPQVFALPAPRQVPSDRRIHAGHYSLRPSDGYAPLPLAVLPVIEPIAAAHLREHDEIEAARTWPVGFERREKRRPTWGELEAAYPRIGAWMADRRRA